MAFVREVLGDGAHECFRGVIDNRPGSVLQEWHSDGHEWEEEAEAEAEAEAARAAAHEEGPPQGEGEGAGEGAAAGVVPPPGRQARRVTCFIPLVDLDDASCGATQFFPGSHLQVRSRECVCVRVWV